LVSPAVSPPSTRGPRPLWDAALAVLRANDLGGCTKPAPRLYPHQWSLDSAFIAIGLARVDPDRALRELETLFAAQWADGRIPHIVFNPDASDYFPGPDRWACASITNADPRAPATSGLVHHPVQALAARSIYEAAPDPTPLLPRLRALYPRLLAWHRYLATARDPEASGLLTIYHPWEGTDNAPRWDAPLANLAVGEVPPYIRHDLKHVADPSERPTQAEYDRYLWLVESLKAARYDDAAVYRAHPFLVKDVLFSAIFAAACQALGELADHLRAPREGREELAGWARRSSAAVQGRWDEAEHLALDLDVRAGAPIRVRTCAGFAPLLVPDLDRALADRLVERLFGPEFAGAPGLAFRVVPSTAPRSPGFRARAYWRGPSWPVINWLLGWGLAKQGYPDHAAALRESNLALLSQPDAHFAEYFEPFTGRPLGSADQSWTAAVALDWLASNRCRARTEGTR
jgi:hypothetical protein